MYLSVIVKVKGHQYTNRQTFPSRISAEKMGVFEVSGHYSLICTVGHCNYQTLTMSAHIYLPMAYFADENASNSNNNNLFAPERNVSLDQLYISLSEM